MKSKKKTDGPKSIRRILALPFLAALILTGCRSDAPVIFSIHPAIGVMGEPVTILGSFFGEERDSSYVTIGGARPTGTAYMEWYDNRIRLRVPDFGEAGLVFVHVGGRRSNGVLFANQATMPRAVDDGRPGLGPMVTSVTPQAGAVGSVVTITGSGFGGSRGSGGVFFSRNTGTVAGMRPWSEEWEFIQVSDAEFGYELWSDREIRVRIPSGATSGNMEVRTARGNSPPLFFEINGSPGTKDFVDRRSFMITYSVNIRTGNAETPNVLHLWVPTPAASVAHQNAELLFSNPEPFIQDYFGTSLYRLDNLVAHGSTDINLSWMVEVYGIQTSVQPQAIRREVVSPIRDAHTRSCPRLPSDDTRIRSLVTSILAGENNPYLQARRIYDWMLNIAWEDRVQGDIFQVIEARQADPFIGTLLYATMLRAAGIPSQPVAGVLVGRNNQTMNHYWVEFWLDGLGWIPVDPAMGAGAIPEAFAHPGSAAFGDAPRDPADFYFGNIDNRRIVFSRGFTDLSQMDPRGRTVTHVRSFALQSPWEEAVGGIESYSSLWGNIIITGMHAQ